VLLERREVEKRTKAMVSRGGESATEDGERK
jgi:hypothetical protein